HTATASPTISTARPSDGIARTIPSKIPSRIGAVTAALQPNRLERLYAVSTAAPSAERACATPSVVSSAGPATGAAPVAPTGPPPGDVEEADRGPFGAGVGRAQALAMERGVVARVEVLRASEHAERRARRVEMLVERHDQGLGGVENELLDGAALLAAGLVHR